MRLWRQIRLFMTFPSGVYFKELLVCRLCIILLSLYELMVEINIIHLTLFQLTRCKHKIDQLGIECVSRVEIVVLTRI